MASFVKLFQLLMLLYFITRIFVTEGQDKMRVRIALRDSTKSQPTDNEYVTSRLHNHYCDLCWQLFTEIKRIVGPQYSLGHLLLSDCATLRRCGSDL
jgi:hypothetical protein